MAEEENFDIYGDLNEFDASVKLKETTVELQALRETHRETVKQLEAAEAVNKHTKTINATIKKNFYLLLNTARAEVDRKDRRITEMRENMDNMAFRRNRKKLSKYTQTEDVQENGRRKNSYNRSLHNNDTYRKRRINRERSPDPKRRRRSVSHERNHRKEEKSHRKSRGKSQKKEIREKSHEKDRTHNDQENKRDPKDVNQEINPQKNEISYQEASLETIEAAANLLHISKAPPLPPQDLPDTTPSPITSPLNRSITVGNKNYSIAQDNQGAVHVVLHRKKRKGK